MSVLADRYGREELTGIKIEALVKIVVGTSISQFSTESFSYFKPIFTSKLIGVYCMNI
jgi:hypothetical protein